MQRFGTIRLPLPELTLALFLVLGLACSNGSTVDKDGTSPPDSMAPDQAVVDVPVPEDVFELLPDDDLTGTDTAPDVADVEGEADGGGLPVCAGPGEFFCECEDNKDCLSGYCVETLQGKLCTSGCVEDCPAGWACVQDENALPDVIYICLPQNVYLCRPCNDNEECHSPYAKSKDLCVSHGDDGSFCAVDCSVKGECPDGYVCAEVVTQGGSTAHQCVPSNGECECSQKAINENATTDCRRANGYGECLGERTCAAGGLTECSALTPKPEECNGLDDNCDGEIDPPNSLKCITYYYDQDGDGFGIGAGSCECKAPSPNHVPKGGDCDDSNLGVHPDVDEACNFIDDNCDGLTDESYAEGCEIMYFDGDEDGWGDAGATDCLCKESPNYKKQKGDCNDENPATYPDAEELCDGEDNDCDDVIDEENALGCVPYYLDQDKDGYGLSDQLKCLCGKVGDYTAVKGGDCDDTIYEVHPTVVELCDGLDNDCDGAVDEDEAISSCGVVAHGTVACDNGCVVDSCEEGFFDLNGAFADGCECQLEPGEVLNQTCGDATFVEQLEDDGDSAMVTGRIVPAEDSDWYKVTAVDKPDKDNCDTFHLRAHFVKNDGDAYQFDVFKGGCAGADNLCAGTTEFEYFTDFHKKLAEEGIPGHGECKCMPDADKLLTPTNYKDDTDANSHQCTSQTADYYIRVYRKPGAPVLCDQYQLEISNGAGQQ